MKKDTPTPGKVIETDEARIKDYLGELVRGPVTISTRLRVDKCTLSKASGGATSPPSQVWRAGISPPWQKAADWSVMVMAARTGFGSTVHAWRYTAVTRSLLE